MIIPEKLNLNKDKPRIKTLDSLRGLAAITVVIAHCTGTINYYLIIDKSPLYIFKAAHEAVIFFFLLSGYVLVYQYESKIKFKYGEFLILRFCRIYIPYIICLLFAIILYTSIHPNYINNTFFGSQGQLPLKTDDIVGHIVMINNFNTNALDPVIWSLVHEMRVAIIFPLLLLIVQLKPSIAILIGLIISFLSAIFIVLNINPSLGYLNGYFYTLYYFYIFILGGLIVKNQSALLSRYERLKSGQKTIFIIFTLVVYTYSHTIPWIITKLHLKVLMDFSFVLEDLLTSAAAVCLIIIAIQQSKKRTFLDSRIPLFLGRISYSLYLVHIPIIAFLYKELHNKVSIYTILLLGVTLSIIFAKLFNLYIERNATKLGKKLTFKSL